MTDRQPVVLIGLDAMDRTLVQRLLDEGRMPNIQRLRERGCWGPVETQPTCCLSMVWPTFYNGIPVGRHGWYYGKMWRPEKMRVEYVRPDWVPHQPFWTLLDARYRQCIVDMPFSPDCPRDFNGVFLAGWQTHDDFGSFSVPPSALGDLKRRFGKPRLHPEHFGPQSVASLLRQRAESIETNEQFGALSADLLGGETWDLFLTVFGAAHRGGHYLWDLSQIDTAGAAAEDLRTLEGACADVYASTDRAVGVVLDECPPDARIILFALHGMAANPGWSDHFAAMVARIQSDGADGPAKPGLVYRLKRKLPWSVVRQVTTRLPTAVNKALVPMWSQRMYDWSTTRYFPLPQDLNGYLRINLKGREAQGIVEPGAEYDALCAELAEACMSFRDIESGRPIVKDVVRAEDLSPADAPGRRLLPDLVVVWDDVSAADSTGVRSERYGEVRWPRGARYPSGRCGNHVKSGWLVAAGPGIEPGELHEVHDAVDIMPTVLTWMGAEIPAHFAGRPIAGLGQV